MSLGGHPQILGVGGCLPGGAGGWRDLHGDLLAEPGPRGQVEVITAPEAAGVVPVRPAPTGQQPHGLVGDGDDFGAVGGLKVRVCRAPLQLRYPPAQPPPGEPGRRGKRRAVQARDGTQDGVFRLPGERVFELAQPRPLAVPRGPDDDGLAQVVQLGSPLVGARPQVGQGPAELSVPHQRRQVFDDHGHANVVDRAVRAHLDGTVGHLVPAKEPHVTGTRQVEGLVEAERDTGHGCSLDRCAGGRYWAWRPSLGWPQPAWRSPGRSGAAARTPRRKSGPGYMPASPRRPMLGRPRATDPGGVDDRSSPGQERPGGIHTMYRALHGNTSIGSGVGRRRTVGQRTVRGAFAAVDALRAAYADVPAGASGQADVEPVPLPSAGPRARTGRESDDQVLAVDPQTRTADVQGMATYERLVDATLPHGSCRWWSRSSRPSHWAARSPDWASSRRRSATGCRTSRCASLRCSPGTAGWS